MVVHGEDNAGICMVTLIDLNDDDHDDDDDDDNDDNLCRVTPEDLC